MSVNMPYEARRILARRPKAYQSLVDWVVIQLRESRDISQDTGRLKRGFRRNGSGLSSYIFNPVFYARIVEAKTRGVAITMRRIKDRIIRQAKKLRGQQNIKTLNNKERFQLALQNVMAANLRRRQSIADMSVVDIIAAIRKNDVFEGEILIGTAEYAILREARSALSA